ncbi:RNA polymerase, sigma-24 subunit, ECF subfamily (plasmid) [Pseudovibrio sp. FO-BEG1]|uniref:RNA polymerase sigma-70 factor n=1 Tax=Pseudovibrio sp. (strain FO-BEG1) TaxID=911045 RepID=UPI000238CBE3|nr:RNA polymerase sigma-70 factor [Pseudovibrio sp. FO-BEG1]AEV39746.1 RNA polymerase, sigma-24 subunit, ECF subfamily [Pseudovibrio sp. FO-BEG1]
MTSDKSLCAFEQARPMLMGLAYRLLGSTAEAEDVVQETYLSWSSAIHDDISNAEAWLTTVCTRKALDHLKSARKKRENYVGMWLPEPLHTTTQDTPEDRVELSESLTMAFLLVMERLAPKERAAFLLREVFSSSYEEVADILEVTPASCRKLVSRAKANIQQKSQRFVASAEKQREMVHAFQSALETGETSQLSQLLAADVALLSDGGGKVNAIPKPLVGLEQVLGFIDKAISPAASSGRAWVEELNACLSLVTVDGGGIVTTFTFGYDEEMKVNAIYAQRNPDKLSAVQ